MSSSQKYWCHGCEKNLDNAISTEDGLECPDCNQLFVEILEDESLANDGFVEEKKSESMPSAFSQPSASASGQTSSAFSSSSMNFGSASASGPHFFSSGPNGPSMSVRFGSFGGNGPQAAMGGNPFDILQAFGMQQNQQQQQSSSSSANNSQASSSQSAQSQSNPAQNQPQQQAHPMFRGFSFQSQSQPQGDGQQRPIMDFQQLLGNLGDMFGPMGAAQGAQGGGAPAGLQQMFSQMVGAPITGNLGDYGFGRSLSDIMATLVDPNRHGPPPASDGAIGALHDVTITEAHVASNAQDCAVCKDSFKVGESAKELPCEHMFHPDCVLPWLKEHCTCPVCRYELATTNQFFEQQRATRNANRRNPSPSPSASAAAATSSSSSADTSNSASSAGNGANSSENPES